MRRHTVIAILMATALTVGVSAWWSASTTERDGDTAANLISDSGSPTGRSVDDKKGGSRIGRMLRAPMRAVSHLFGHGRDNDRIERMTARDAARFESAGAMRVADGEANASERPVTSGSARDHLASGRSLLENGRVNDAIAELSQAVSLDPTLGEASNLMGVAYDRKGMPERARICYERAARYAPADAQTLNNLGFSLYVNGNYRAAVDRLKRAARLAPSDERILNNLALAQCRLGKYDEAFRNFARAGGELGGRLNTATMLERAGRYDEAVKHYEAALRLEPNSSIALRRLADLYERAGRSEDAAAAARTLAEKGTETAALVSAGEGK